MRREDIIAFARRDWASVAEAKERYWAKRKSSMTPTEALRRRGPAPEDRADDLASHERVAEMLNHVGTRRGR